MFRSRSSFSVLIILLCMFGGQARAELRLPSILGDHMVLQQQAEVAIWGWAKPGEDVTVLVSSKSYTATADPDGAWRVVFEPMAATFEPLQIVVQSSSGERLTIKDVLVGEVWLCAGQSNMDFKVAHSENREDAVANADLPGLRVFSVNQERSAEPRVDVEGQWKQSDSKSVLMFTAVGYYFGRELHRELNVPVGLIHDAWGGTRIEAWTPLQAFENNPVLHEDMEVIRADNQRYELAKKEAVNQIESWLKVAREAIENEAAIPAPPDWPTSALTEKNKPTSVYNAMVHPITPYAIRGVAWYQGESNNGDGPIYRDRMQSLIQSWRAMWQNPDMPFYYVQIAPYKYGGSLHPAYALPWMWEAQRQILEIHNTGMVVTTDVAEVDNLHPPRKLEVGRRLSLWALSHTYGRKDIVCCGPIYSGYRIDGDSIRVTFKHAAGLTSSDGKPLSWFTIAGEDMRFVDADARVDGDSVIVRSSEVKHPVAVRFGWDQIAQPNLVNAAGLPAICFRTDTLPYSQHE